MQFKSLAVATVLSVAHATEVDVHVVSVGKNPCNGETGLMFSPEKIVAAIGSRVQFQFLDGNHTATQSDFDHPCVPINQIDPSKPGIFSGFQPVAASKDQGRLPVFDVMITDDKPIWMFCSQGMGAHCKKGMSMVINENTSANETRSLENYKNMAGETTPGSEYNGGGGNGTYMPPPPPPADTGVAPPPPAETEAPPPDTEAPPPPAETEAPPAETEAPPPPSGNGTAPDTPIPGRASGFAVPSTMLAVLAAAAFVLL